MLRDDRIFSRSQISCALNRGDLQNIGWCNRIWNFNTSDLGLFISTSSSDNLSLEIANSAINGVQINHCINERTFNTRPKYSDGCELNRRIQWRIVISVVYTIIIVVRIRLHSCISTTFDTLIGSTVSVRIFIVTNRNLGIDIVNVRN